MLKKPQMSTDIVFFPTMGKSAAGSTQIPVQGEQPLTSHLPLEDFKNKWSYTSLPHIVAQKHNKFCL
jgi:hypothetical protein